MSCQPLHSTGYEPKASDARRRKLFKIRIICKISFDNIASSFWSLEGYEDFVETKRRCNFVNWESTVKSFTVICRDDAIVCPHHQSKIQESLEDPGKLLVDPPSRTTIVVSQNASVVSCWLTLVTKACHLPFVWLLWRDNFAEHLLINRSHEPDAY